MSNYPTIGVGTRVTSTLLTSMQPNWYLKAANTTRTSTTTVADDPDLSVAVEANGIYYVKFEIKFEGLAAADFKTQWSVPSGATGNRNVNGPGSTAADSNADNLSSKWGVHGLATAVTYNCARDSASLQQWCQEWAVITVGATAGNVSLAWAQGTSNATGTVVVAGSLATTWRIA